MSGSADVVVIGGPAAGTVSLLTANPTPARARRESATASSRYDDATASSQAVSVTALNPDPELPPAIERFVERFRAGITARPELAARLRGAGMSVCLKSRSGGGVTLLLDREPPLLRPVAEPAEIVVELDDDDFLAVISGEALLPVVLASRDARCEGPTRRFLTVTPIMRTLWRVGGGIR